MLRTIRTIVVVVVDQDLLTDDKRDVWDERVSAHARAKDDHRESSDAATEKRPSRDMPERYEVRLTRRPLTRLPQHLRCFGDGTPRVDHVIYLDIVSPESTHRSLG